MQQPLVSAALLHLKESPSYPCAVMPNKIASACSQLQLLVMALPAGAYACSVTVSQSLLTSG